MSWLVVVSLLYFTILVGYYNYRIYLVSHAPFLGVQGRYLSPVLVPACLAASHFMLSWRQRWLKILIAVAVSAVFLWGDLPFFLRHAGDAWYSATEVVSP